MSERTRYGMDRTFINTNAPKLDKSLIPNPATRREDIIKALRDFHKPQSLTLIIIDESSPFTDELAKALDRLYKQRFSNFETPRAGNQPDKNHEKGTAK